MKPALKFLRHAFQGLYSRKSQRQSRLLVPPINTFFYTKALKILLFIIFPYIWIFFERVVSLWVFLIDVTLI